jgi:hypothetical protein
LLTAPCTSLPGNLAQAIENGSTAILEAGASIETGVNVTIASVFDRDAAGDEDPISCFDGHDPLGPGLSHRRFNG